LRANGFDVVKRPTGGGAILHANELTYAVAMRLDDLAPTQAYARITGGVVEGLRSLGIEPDDEHPSDLRYTSSAVCFGGFARNEVRVGGRKLVGSAQRVLRDPEGPGAILQHGSILLGPEHARLALVLAGLGPDERARTSDSLVGRSTDITSLCGRSVDVEEVAEAMQAGFSSTFERIGTEVVQ
jgi:lipoate-protein ligase A